MCDGTAWNIVTSRSAWEGYPILIMDRLGRSAVSRGIMLPSTLECDKGLRNIMDILAHCGLSWYRNVMDCLGDHCIWWDSMEQHGAPWNSVGIIMSRSGLEAMTISIYCTSWHIAVQRGTPTVKTDSCMLPDHDFPDRPNQQNDPKPTQGPF